MIHTMANPRRSWSMFKVVVVVVVVGMLSMTAVSARTDPDPETNDGDQDKVWMVEQRKNYEQDTLASAPSPSAESEEAQVAENGNYEQNTILVSAPSPNAESEEAQVADNGNYEQSSILASAPSPHEHEHHGHHTTEPSPDAESEEAEVAENENYEHNTLTSVPSYTKHQHYGHQLTLEPSTNADSKEAEVAENENYEHNTLAPAPSYTRDESLEQDTTVQPSPNADLEEHPNYVEVAARVIDNGQNYEHYTSAPAPSPTHQEDHHEDLEHHTEAAFPPDFDKASNVDIAVESTKYELETPAPSYGHQVDQDQQIAAPSPTPDSEQDQNVAVVKHENHEPLTPASPPHPSMRLFRSHHGRFLPHFVLHTLKPWHNAPGPGPGPADSMQEDSKQDTLPSKSFTMQGLNAAIPHNGKDEGDKVASAQPHDDKHKHIGHDTKPPPPNADFQDDSIAEPGVDHKNLAGAAATASHGQHDHNGQATSSAQSSKADVEGVDHKNNEHKTLSPAPLPAPSQDHHEQHGHDTTKASQKPDFEDDSSEDGADHKTNKHNTLVPPPSPRPTGGPSHDHHEQHGHDTAATPQKPDFEDDSSEDGADHKTNEHNTLVPPPAKPSKEKAKQDSKPAPVDHLHEHGTTAPLNLAPTPAPAAQNKSKRKLFGKSQKNVAIAGNDEYDTPVPAPSYDHKGYDGQNTPGPSPNVDFEEHKEETSNGVVVGHENNEHIDTLTPPPHEHHEHHGHHISASPRHPIARRYGYFFPGS
ncbi:unnamed protein product [Calypogeia fissa]